MTDPGTDPGQQPPAANPTPPKNDPAPEPFFVAKTQDDLNKKVGNVREEGRSSVLKDLGFEDFDDLKETVEAYRLVESEMETEAEKYQREVEKYKPQAEKAERYEGALKTYLDQERDGLPPHITALLDRMDVADQLEWLSANKEHLKAPSRVPGSPDATSASGRDPVEEHMNKVYGKPDKATA
jgi:hypothetical protein